MKVDPLFELLSPVQQAQLLKVREALIAQHQAEGVEREEDDHPASVEGA